jgi:hypothetical protein
VLRSPGTSLAGGGSGGLCLGRRGEESLRQGFVVRLLMVPDHRAPGRMAQAERSWGLWLGVQLMTFSVMVTGVQMIIHLIGSFWNHFPPSQASPRKPCFPALERLPWVASGIDRGGHHGWRNPFVS